MCPYDFAEGAFLIDDDVRDLFAGIPEGVNLTCFFDCCHSGTNTRFAVGATAGSSAMGSDQRRRFIPATEQMKAAHRAFREEGAGFQDSARGWSGSHAQRRLLGLSPSEVAWESNGHGDFTVRATRVLANGVDSMTNMQFAERVIAEFGVGARQRPLLDCAPAARSLALLQPLGAGNGALGYRRRSGRQFPGGNECRDHTSAASVDSKAAAVLARSPSCDGRRQHCLHSRSGRGASAEPRRKRTRPCASAGARSVRDARSSVQPGAESSGRRHRLTSAKGSDPIFRQLRIYTVDPATPRLDGAVALVDVPYEPLEPGPVGALFSVDDYDFAQQVRYRRADLEDRTVLLGDGYPPSQSDPRFHQQMVYAVCSNVYAAFKKALGRHIAWKRGGRLVIRPHAEVERNAYYDEVDGELRFGYYSADQASIGPTLPGGYVFTCLSHDIVAHEVTHALLDGLRAHFSRPSGVDVVAFHEAFADLVALFQRFSYKEVVRNAIRRYRGDIARAPYLTELALQVGHTTGKKKALRSAIDSDSDEGQPCQPYDPTLEPHALGSVLVAAVFEAFRKIYQRKTERYLRLATCGTGILPAGELPHDLQEVLADRVAKLAGQFLSICIRAIDYCAPVGLTFGAYLRALVTADRDLVPDDPWDYRGALIEAFRRRDIYPRDVGTLSEDALLWRPTRKPLPPIDGLSFANLRFSGDPGHAAGEKEVRRQACVLGDYVSRPEHLEEFGLVAQGDPRLEGDLVSLPTVESVRSSRRIGPDGQIVFDLVAEVTQSRIARIGGARFEYHGGSTVILGPEGEIRYVILNSVVGAGRLERRRQYVSDTGKPFWHAVDGSYAPRQHLFMLLHRNGNS